MVKLLQINNQRHFTIGCLAKELGIAEITDMRNTIASFVEGCTKGRSDKRCAFIEELLHDITDTCSHPVSSFARVSTRPRRVKRRPAWRPGMRHG